MPNIMVTLLYPLYVSHLLYLSYFLSSAALYSSWQVLGFGTAREEKAKEALVTWGYLSILT
jgi:hypothetical protein